MAYGSSVLAMAKTRGAYAMSPSTRNPRPELHLRGIPYLRPTGPLPIPPSEGGVPSNLSSTQKQLSGDLWLHNNLLKEIWIVEPVHSTPSYVLIWRLSDSSRSLEIHSAYCRDTIWSNLMTPRDFFYSRVALDFLSVYDYSLRPESYVIHFTIDGRHGASTRMLLVNVVLRSNIFHFFAYGAEEISYIGGFILDIRGFLLWPSSFDLTSLLHFEEKVHRKKL
ncbi:hypothetical protein CK203_102211 [Vitis vinifera]|uniref:Uncharacterized protein n=1 Tax=Vitis vinifera TaxID=29760 RepID=A0A438DFL9_VITVI|nr:hypothetical protein CK203_102211 [Vitis vinifera]